MSEIFDLLEFVSEDPKVDESLSKIRAHFDIRSDIQLCKLLIKTGAEYLMTFIGQAEDFERRIQEYVEVKLEDFDSGVPKDEEDPDLATAEARP